MKVISIWKALGRRMALALSLCSVLLGTASAASSSNKLTGPTNLFICPGANGQFSTTASGPTPYTFKWLKNGTLLAGKTSNSLTISNATTSDAGTYSVILTGGANSVTNSATLTLKTNVAATPLVSLVRAVGANAVFSTTASGTGPFSYVWKKNGNVLSGQTASSLTLVNVGTNSSGVYSVTVSGACSSAEQSATLTVAECFPALDVMLVIDRSGSMQGTPYHNARLACSNFVHNLKLTAATTNSDTAGLASYNSAASLDQTLTNRMASLEQAIAGIPAANGNTSITLGLQTGRTELFSARRRDYALPVIVLLSDGLPTGGDTGSNALYQATLAKNSGARVFTVGLGAVDHTLMGNIASSTNDYFYTTNSAQLTALFNAISTVICRPPTNVIGPSSLILCPGATANFNVTATGCDAFTYQWFKNGALLGGQTSDSLTRANVSSADAGVYSVAVSSACLTVTNSATLTVNTNITAIGPFAQTNCTGGSVVFSTAASGTGPITYQWFKNGALLTNQTAATLTLNSISATDAASYSVAVSGACGAPVTNTASLTVSPLPTLTATANQIVESGAPWTFGTPTANYPISIVNTVTNTGGACGNTFSATRTWRATDACGNFADAAQTITVVDTTAPTISCIANRSVECGAAWSFDAPTASDGIVTVLSTTTNAVCGNSFAATRTWVATDACGNTAQCSQTVTVHDTTAPVLACVANKTVEAGADWDFDSPTASDVCGTNTISILSTVTNAACGNTYTATRTWQATDACGNSSQCSQTVTINDTTAPTLACVANKTVECSSAWTFDAPTATDIGGTNAIAVANTVTNAACGNTLSATRTWTATDACGNVAQCSQTVTVIDTTAPTILCLAGKTIETGVAWDFDAPSATDVCGTNSITILSTTTNSACGNTFAATRTWQATDACGNTAQCSQTVTVNDSTAPTLTCVANKTVECGSVWTFDAPSATDVGGTNAITILSTVTNAACGNTFSATRTWTATDACGNVAQCSQTVTVADTTAPVITCIANKIVEAGVAWDFDAPTAADGCGTNAITILSTTTNALCGNTFTATRTWQVTDACGNTAQCSQTVTVNDSTAPTLTCVASKTVECGSVWTFDAPSATDIGGTNAITIFSTVTNAACGSTFSATRTWTATDACGNVAQCSQTVIVVDTTAPAISCVANKTIETGAAWDFDAPSATDVCGTNAISIVSTTTNAGCGNAFTTTRTWQATDACGNSSECSQTVTVVDTTAPTLTCVASKTVECGSAWNFDAPSATDIGGSNSIAVLNTVTNAACGYTFSATRTWTATDACGNVAQCSQTVTIVDTTAPVIVCAASKTVEAGAAWDFDAPTAADGCGTNSIRLVNTITNSLCGSTFTATRTWQATDACGNTAECSQTVTVNDTTAPTLTCVAGKTVECGSAWTFDAPAASDGTIAVVSTTTNAACGQTFRATRTWSATDTCGNVAQCAQTVTVIDTTAPVITCAANKTVESGAAWSFDAPSATDVCGTNSITVVSTTTNSVGACGSTFTATRTWQATDACGNTAQCSQTVTVVDTTAPGITCVAGKLVEKGANWSFDPPTVSEGTLSIVSTVTNDLGCAVSATRTWQVVDSCGNVAQCSQTVSFVDTTAPAVAIVSPTNGAVFIAPANFTVVANVQDIGGPIALVEFFSGTNKLGEAASDQAFLVLTNVAIGSYNFTVRATDNCGNAATSAPVVVNVIERPPLTILSNLRINPATSLWEQKVRVTNPTYSTFDAVRVYVQGLPASVTVFNASGAKTGVPYVQTPTAIPPNSYVDFVIEYYTTSGSVPAPTLRAELVQATGGGGAASLFGTQQRINRALMLPNRQFIVEFATLAGRTYAVQYSADLTTWQTAQGGITGNGSWYQWVDGGLPKTESAPRDTRLRFYRVILLP